MRSKLIALSLSLLLAAPVAYFALAADSEYSLSMSPFSMSDLRLTFNMQSFPGSTGYSALNGTYTSFDTKSTTWTNVNNTNGPFQSNLVDNPVYSLSGNYGTFTSVSGPVNVDDPSLITFNFDITSYYSFPIKVLKVPCGNTTTYPYGYYSSVTKTVSQLYPSLITFYVNDEPYYSYVPDNASSSQSFVYPAYSYIESVRVVAEYPSSFTQTFTFSDKSVRNASSPGTSVTHYLFSSSSTSFVDYSSSISSNYTIEPIPEPATLDDILDALLENTSVGRYNSSVLESILSAIQSFSDAASVPSAMEQFEQRYLEKMEGQLSQVEDMMSPDNPALPNGGDIAGFASDIQNGLGVSGSAFNASEFSDALSAFSGAEATAAGGPWEFFTQAVADSLSGDAQTAGLNDDDYIYAWLEMMQGRYSSWSSSSP